MNAAPDDARPAEVLRFTGHRLDAPGRASPSSVFWPELHQRRSLPLAC